MLRLTITLISLINILSTVNFNDFFTDYNVPLNIVYSKGTASLTLISAKNFSLNCDHSCKLNFDLLIEAKDTNLYFNDSLPLEVRDYD
jgi:hypothetical protein